MHYPSWFYQGDRITTGKKLDHPVVKYHNGVQRDNPTEDEVDWCEENKKPSSQDVFYLVNFLYRW